MSNSGYAYFLANYHLTTATMTTKKTFVSMKRERKFKLRTKFIRKQKGHESLSETSLISLAKVEFNLNMGSGPATIRRIINTAEQSKNNGRVPRNTHEKKEQMTHLKRHSTIGWVPKQIIDKTSVENNKNLKQEKFRTAAALSLVEIRNTTENSQKGGLEILRGLGAWKY